MILLVGLGALIHSDLEHEASLNAVVFPLVTLVAVMALAVWVIVFLARLGARRRRCDRRFDIGVSTDFDGDGGDAGGGD